MSVLCRAVVEGERGGGGGEEEEEEEEKHSPSCL